MKYLIIILAFLTLYSCQSNTVTENQTTATATSNTNTSEEVIANKNTSVKETTETAPPKRAGYVYLETPFEFPKLKPFESKIKFLKENGIEVGSKLMFVTANMQEVELVCNNPKDNFIEFETYLLNDSGERVGEATHLIYEGRIGDANQMFYYNSSIRFSDNTITLQQTVVDETDFDNETAEEKTTVFSVSSNGITRQ